MEKKGYIKPDTTEMNLPELLDYSIVGESKGYADEGQEAGAKIGGVYWDDEEFDDEEDE